MKTNRYTIMGLTGQVGGAIARALLENGQKVRGIVRDRAKAASWEAAGVELVIADWNDTAALQEAFRDTQGVFVMMPPNFAPAPGFPDAKAIAAGLRQALEKAMPERVVALSSVGAHRTSGLGLITQCHILEQALMPLPMPKAFVRAAWFLENFQWDVAPAREHGEMASFLNPLDRPFPMVATKDIGKLAARTLQQTWSGNRFLELEGPQRYSQLDAAATFARLLGRPVAPKPILREEGQGLFESQGTAPDRTSPRIEMIDGFNSGWIDFEKTGTEHFKGEQTQEEVFRNLLRGQA
jgi:NAD(P)H dehydrogenase (quinone)